MGSLGDRLPGRVAPAAHRHDPAHERRGRGGRADGALTPEAVFLRKVKRHQGDGLWGSYAVGDDEHGRWFFTPERSRYRGTAKGEVAFCYTGQPDEPGRPVIHLIPRGEWWFARWQGDHVAIDLCTPAVLVGADVWSYDDLELDLYKTLDGRSGVVDEDEFLEAFFDGHITTEELGACLDTAASLRRRLADGDELFDDLAWRRLQQWIDRDLPPLTDFPS